MVYPQPTLSRVHVNRQTELHGVEVACSQLVPSGGGYTLTGNEFICAVAGAVEGQ